MMLKIQMIIGVVCLIVLLGCTSKSYQKVGGRETSQGGVISKEELRAALDKFEDFAVLSIRQAVNQLEKSEISPGSQKVHLLASVRLSQAFHVMLEQDDPLIAFIEGWGLSRRMTRYFVDGEGSILHGDKRQTMIDASKKVEAEIEQIGRRFLDQETFDEMQVLIENFVNQNPIKGSFVNLIEYAVETVPGEPSPFSRVISIPMAPFKAVQGVDRTASSIYGVRNSMERFTTMMADLPETTRWQLMLLLLDMKDVDAVKEFLDNMAMLSESSSKMAATLDGYPEKIQQQMSALMQEIDAKQTNVQATLQKAQDAAVAVEKATSQIKETIASANSAVKDINQTMLAWTDAADATTGALSIIKGWTDAPRQGPSTFKITDYRDVASETARAAGELRTLLAQANGKLDAAIDRITWRCVQIILLLFTLGAVYRLVFVRRSSTKEK